MVKVALFVRLEAKPGKEKEVESFLMGGLPLVMEEPATTAWFGIRLGPSTFGIFDAFPDEAGRQAHLSGKVAAALMAKALSCSPSRRRFRKLTYSQQNYPLTTRCSERLAVPMPSFT
jgi:quinol monooxygenase YgiN